METESKPQLEKQLLFLGRSMIIRFFVLLKTAQNYSEGHQAMSLPVAQLLTLIRELHKLNTEAVIRLKAGYLSLGDVRLKSDASGYEAFRFTMGAMQGCFIRSINFTPAVSEVEIKRFAYIFGEIPPMPASQTFVQFKERLQQRMIKHIELQSMSEDQELAILDETVDMDSKMKPRRIYVQALKEVAEVMRLAARSRPLTLMKSKRIIQNMVDQLRANESQLLALSTIRNNESYTCHHLINVTILSLAIGQRIGLSKNRRCDLGIAALYHDIGKTCIPDEILDKEEDFSEEEETIIQEHPLFGVKVLMELKAPDALAASMIAANFEHHLHYDFTGYPHVSCKKQSLFGRIIGIADDYDSLTSARVYYRLPHAPEKVIRFMLSPSCKLYDPVLLKLFVNAIGIYPVGTLLLLNSGELAIILRINPDPAKWMLPVVKIIAYSNGEEVDGEVIDLVDANAGRSIIRAIDPHPFKIDVTRYLL